MERAGNIQHDLFRFIDGLESFIGGKKNYVTN